MACVRDLLAKKGADVVSLPAGATVLDAARVMNEHGIGGVVVTEGGQMAGIFTERDVLRRVVAEGRAPEATRLGEVMTAPVMSCLPETSLEEIGAIMSSHRVRHLPVVGSDGLAGLVTSGDLLAFQVAEQRDTIQYLNSYMFDVR